MSEMAETKIVLPGDPEAATRKTITGWVGRDGYFYGDGDSGERAARYAGSTHRRCETPGCTALIARARIRCESCQEKIDWAKWSSAPRVVYDGVAMLYDDQRNKYYADLDDATKNAEWAETTVAQMRLYICEPAYGRELNGDFFEDELPEDGELPDAIVEAMNALNKAVREAGPLSWHPGKNVPIFTPT